MTPLDLASRIDDFTSSHLNALWEIFPDKKIPKYPEELFYSHIDIRIHTLKTYFVYTKYHYKKPTFYRSDAEEAFHQWMQVIHSYYALKISNDQPITTIWTEEVFQNQHKWLYPFDLFVHKNTTKKEAEEKYTGMDMTEKEDGTIDVIQFFPSGVYRTKPISTIVGGKYHPYPPHETIPDFMQVLWKKFHATPWGKLDISEIFARIFAHFLAIGEIHPFNNGNGSASMFFAQSMLKYFNIPWNIIEWSANKKPLQKFSIYKTFAKGNPKEIMLELNAKK